MNKHKHHVETYWEGLWNQFKKQKFGYFGFVVVLVFAIVAIYAPFLASSKPLWVYYDGQWFFPLFRYLFYTGFYTKYVDIFFNLLIFIFPAGWVVWKFSGRRSLAITLLVIFTFICFSYLTLVPLKDPAADLKLAAERQAALKNNLLPDWNYDLQFMTPYAKLNLLLRYQLRLEQHQHFEQYDKAYQDYAHAPLPTLWEQDARNRAEEDARQSEVMKNSPVNSTEYQYALARIRYNAEKQEWLSNNLPLVRYEFMPILRHIHWEEDAGGEQSLNQFLPWWDLTRINRKDLLAALIFGVRISLVVGILSVFIALAIGIPIGAYAGYFGGRFDIVVSRLLEIWESMPTFFMLLFVVAIMQSKTIFLVIAVIGIFGWTTFSRYIRGEFFKQRNLPYVEACKAQGFSNGYIVFSQILPNAIPPVLTLLPFAMMGAITGEAGLSFLGLGEEGSCSWGVLMDEGRRAFPGESYLLWPPAILLTILLVAIALVGDAIRDALDPKLRRQ